MGLFEDLDSERKKSESEGNRAEMVKQVRDLGREIDRAGHERSAEVQRELRMAAQAEPAAAAQETQQD